MSAIVQTTFSNAFSSTKIFTFDKNFHWSLFLGIQLTINQHCFRLWLRVKQASSPYLKQWWSSWLRYICSTKGRWVKNEIVDIFSNPTPELQSSELIKTLNVAMSFVEVIIFIWENSAVTTSGYACMNKDLSLSLRNSVLWFCHCSKQINSILCIIRYCIWKKDTTEPRFTEPIEIMVINNGIHPYQLKPNSNQ